MYEGVIIKETLTDELLLDCLAIDKVEICRTNETIKYWTMIYFRSESFDLPRRIANAIIDDWFVDVKSGSTKYVIFNNKILKYEIGNISEKDEVINYMCTRGIPKAQIAGSCEWGG